MSLAAELAPTGTLRVGIWTVPFFARERDGALSGLIPDLGHELARHAAIPVALSGYASPGKLVDAFRAGLLDVTFVGVTADRAEAIDFGPVVIEIETTYLVPVSSAVAAIAEIDRPGVRIAVPAPSAQQAYLAKIIKHASLLPVPPENPAAALDLLASGKADAFSHVAPMLAAAKGGLPDFRILPGSYFNVPVAIGIAKGRGAAVADFARAFVENVKASGFMQQAIVRADVTGMVVGRGDLRAGVTPGRGL